ncbi:protein suppressor of fri 4 [Galdieria sulphuraria]|nr:protein suppressor of fri 4 [Galdieria sulphuraria]
MGRKKKAPQTDIVDRIFCWYCDRDFQEEKILASHQKEKHFKCQWCNKRLMSVKGLVVHSQQVHKEEVTRVPNAVEGRDSIEHDVFGMEGIPQSYWEEQARKRSPYGYVPHMPFTALYGANPLAGYPRIPTSQYANPYVVPATPVPPPVVAPGEIPAAPNLPLPTQYSASPTYGAYQTGSTVSPAAPAAYDIPPSFSSSSMGPELTCYAVVSCGSSLHNNDKSDSRISKDIGNDIVSNPIHSKSVVSPVSSQTQNSGKTGKIRLVFCPADEETSMEELRAQLPRYQRHLISS